ncbi:MAG: hypothetical protein DDT20_00066 [Firmicutes bacterium]|nr:hypothetical protein [Bacillota bacterium]
MHRRQGALRRGAPSLTTLLGSVFALVFLLSSFFPTSRVLVIQVICHATHTFEVAVGDTVASYFVHSVERTPIFEYLAVEESGLRLTGSRMKSYNAGISTENTLGFRMEDGWFFVPHDTALPSLSLILPRDLTGHSAGERPS